MKFLLSFLFSYFIFFNIANGKEEDTQTTTMIAKNKKDIITINNKANKIEKNSINIESKIFLLSPTETFSNIRLKENINVDNYKIYHNDNKNDKDENLLSDNKQQYTSGNSICDYYNRRNHGRIMKSKKIKTTSSQFCQVRYSQRIGYYCDCR